MATSGRTHTAFGFLGTVVAFLGPAARMGDDLSLALTLADFAL